VIVLIWAGPVIADLAAVRSYLDEQAGARIATRVVSSIREASLGLTQFPHRGRPGRVAGTRELVFGPYVIAYQVQGDSLEILRVLHGTRRWPARL